MVAVTDSNNNSGSSSSMNDTDNNRNKGHDTEETATSERQQHEQNNRRRNSSVVIRCVLRLKGLTYTSLASRVCDEDGSLIFSNLQATLVEDINHFLGLKVGFSQSRQRKRRELQ